MTGTGWFSKMSTLSFSVQKGVQEVEVIQVALELQVAQEVIQAASVD